MSSPLPPEFFRIEEGQITGLEGKVAVITGSSSGIGLATVNLFLKKGAHVIGGDLTPPPSPSPSTGTGTGSFTHIETNATSWPSLRALFAKAYKLHNKIDFVFANAGIGPKANYMELRTDEEGELVEPERATVEVNLLGVVNTVSLGVHYLKMNPSGGSLVLTASVAGYCPFGPADYTASKHGVVGFLRAMKEHLHPKLPIRINALAPSWTDTNIIPVPISFFPSLGIKVQPPSAVALSVALLATDETRHGQTLYSIDSTFKEIEKGVVGGTFVAMDMDGDVGSGSESGGGGFEEFLNKVRAEMAKGKGE